MPNRLPLLLIVIFSVTSFFVTDAQSVGINTATPNASAILDVRSNNKGMLVPRTSSSSRIAIVNPAKGLLLYDTTTNTFWFYNSSAWVQLAAGSSGWSITGNAGTNPATNFIGTTNSQPLRFRVNNVWAGELHPASGNVFFGVGSGQANTTGEANQAVGEHALFANTEGAFNAANGYYALAANTTGYSNTALGGYALSSNTVGYKNTAVGRNALFANTSGTSNTAVGSDALLSNTTGGLNTAIGYQASYSTTTGIENTGVGYQALYSNTTGSSNVAVGLAALYNNTEGADNTALGHSALSANNTGTRNTATGMEALYLNEEGYHNTAMGYQALHSNLTGYQNTAIGFQALYSTTSPQNTGIGWGAMTYNTTGTDNTALGYKALYANLRANYNTAIGFQSMVNSDDATQNTAVGSNSLYNGINTFNNTAVGFYALQYDVSGQFNIAVGAYSGTGGPNAGNLVNTIGIGNTGGFLNGASNQAIIGSESMVFIGGKVNWGVVSDERIKNNIREDVKGLDFILQLRPVTYHISNRAIQQVTGSKDTPDFPGKYDGEKIKYSGFLAQEVEAAAKKAGYDFSGYTVPQNSSQLYTLRYAEFVVPLVKGMQEQEQKIKEQQSTIEALKKEMSELKAAMGLLVKRQ